ncbi:WhiB family transcriptional regulator [Arthrobacter rhombi]|uniref:WhiB family transcriptional regulator n=1 Tax=Arthrobacter rhombi TaxID=71253 RepID=UPI003FCF173D
MGPAGSAWTADSADEQRLAAFACRGCPVLEACAAYVEAFPEPAGVWAGTTERDRVLARQRARAASS